MIHYLLFEVSDKGHEETNRTDKIKQITLKIFTIMKRMYAKPEAIIVDIELYNSVLEEPGNEQPASEPSEANHSVWDDTYERLPGNNSVWGEDPEEVE